MAETHVADWKREKIKDLVDTILASPVIGIVDVKGIPGPQLQNMRKMMRGKGAFRVSKNTFLTLALKEAAAKKSGLEALVDNYGVQNALVATDMNPFMLYKQMDATKTDSPAKGGELAPEDIEIKAGETPFPPGPIVGELQKAGIPAAIERGKVIIKKDKLLVKKGEPIPKVVAQSLTRLEIYPLTVGLDLQAAWENGMIFGKDVLAIDEEQFMGDLHSCMAGAFNLACFIGYTTSLTITPLIQKASSDAFNVAIFAGITNSETIKFLISKAHGQMLSVTFRAGDGLDDELKSILSSQPPPDSGAGGEPDAKKEDKKEEEKEEEVSEEEAAAGLGALFG